MRATQRTGRVTAIRVCNGWWHVPAGFGADYLRRLDPPMRPELLVRILELVGYTASPEAIAAWPLQRRIEAEAYASRAHLIASDNALQSHPMPDWMGEPWQGEPLGHEGGLWDMPRPTVLT